MSFTISQTPLLSGQTLSPQDVKPTSYGSIHLVSSIVHAPIRISTTAVETRSMCVNCWSHVFRLPFHSIQLELHEANQ